MSPVSTPEDKHTISVDVFNIRFSRTKVSVVQQMVANVNNSKPYIEVSRR